MNAVIDIFSCILKIIDTIVSKGGMSGGRKLYEHRGLPM